MNALFRNFFVNGILRAGATVFGVLIEALMVRALAPADYATWGVSLSLSLIAIVLIQYGYQTSAIKIFARHKSGDAAGFHTTLAAAAVIWFLSSLLFLTVFAFFFGIFFPGTADRTLFWAIAIMTIARGINTALAEGMRGIGHIATAAGLSGLGQHGGLVRALGLGAVLVTLHFFGRLDLVSALWAATAVSLAGCGWILILALRQIDDNDPVCVTGVRAAILRDFALNSRLMTAQLLQLGSSRFAANVIGGALALGPTLSPLLLAQQIAQLLLSPLTVLNGAIPNLIIDAHRRGERSELEKLLRAASTLAFPVSAIGALTVTLAGPNLFKFAFGAEHENAYIFCLVLVPGVLFNSYAGSAARALALLGHERAYAVTSFITALVAVPIYWISGLNWGAIGLAVVSSLVLVGQNIVYIWLLHKKLGVRSHANLHPRVVMQAASWIRRNGLKGKPR